MVEHILKCQCEDKPFTEEDITNYYDEKTEEYTEIFEWWVCSPWLIEKLKSIGECVIEHMQLWGRQTTGQALFLDNVFTKIANSLK